jgi:cysteine synthase A
MPTHQFPSNSDSILNHIGKTPLVSIKTETGTHIYCKLEYLNPSGSIKDRVAYNIIHNNWEEVQAKNGLIVEASSGNTTIALAFVCKHLGLKFVAFVPENASEERKWTIQAYGAKLIPVSKSVGMKELKARAQDYAQSNNAFYPNQFHNEYNAGAHHETANEILEKLNGRNISVFIAGVGTGGTIVGMYKHLSSRGHSNIKYVVPRLTTETTLKSIGFTPKEFDCLFKECLTEDSTFRDSVTEEKFTEQAAIRWTHYLWERGFPVGPASGANFGLAVHEANNLSDGEIVVTVFTDRMERYFSTPIFEKIKRALDEGNTARQEKEIH